MAKRLTWPPKIKMNLLRFGETGFVLLAALVFSWGLSVCTQEPAEDFVLVITSIFDATVYFPGSNRLGNLVGLLSSGVSDPVSNYHLQVIIRMTFSLLWPYLACCLVLPRRLRLTTTLVYHGVVLSQFSYTAIHVLYSSNHPYSTSLFLLLSGSLLGRQFVLRRGQYFKVQLATAGLLMLLSNWVNPTTTVYAFVALSIYGLLSVAPSVLGARVLPSEATSYRERYLVTKHSSSMRRLGYVASILFFALVAAVLHARIYAELFPGAVRSFSSPSYLKPLFSLAGISDSFSNLLQEVGGITFAIEALVVLIAIVYLLFCARMSRSCSERIQLRIGLALVIAGIPFVMAFSQLQHMANNGYHPRYFLYFSMFTVFAGCCVLVTMLDKFFSAHHGSIRIWPDWMFYIGLAGLSMYFFAMAGSRQFGFPVRVCEFSKPDSVHASNGHYAFIQGYFGIVGSYWDVWPATFHAWREASNSGVQSRVYPTGYRAEVLAPRMIRDATSRLMAGEKLRLLCIDQGKTGTEFGTIDCEELVRWNQAWGVLPRIGEVSVTPISTYSHLHEIVMELPSVLNPKFRK